MYILYTSSYTAGGDDAEVYDELDEAVEHAYWTEENDYAYVIELEDVGASVLVEYEHTDKYKELVAAEKRSREAYVRPRHVLKLRSLGGAVHSIDYFRELDDARSELARWRTRVGDRAFLEMIK